MHIDMHCFEPTLEAAHARLAAVRPEAYARTRNALDGAVTRLSPYLTHGFLTLREVYSAVSARYPLGAQHKLVFELGWRAYYRHVWSYLGDSVHQSLHTGLLPDEAYQAEVPVDVVEARTGIAAIDLAVQELYATGYVHNHARMWLASYLVHLRKVHWHAGAQWMLGYLLDGDVAKFAPAHWHSFGTVIDASYDVMDQCAHSTRSVTSHADAFRSQAGTQPPDRQVTPSGAAWAQPDIGVAAGREVWLRHPWSLGAAQQLADKNSVSIGIGLAESHLEMPWSERRWRFVREGLMAQTQHLWWGTTTQIARALSGARSVRWQSDPHADVALARLKSQLQTERGSPVTLALPKPCLFAPVEPHCRSFTQWWRQTRINA